MFIFCLLKKRHFVWRGSWRPPGASPGKAGTLPARIFLVFPCISSHFLVFSSYFPPISSYFPALLSYFLVFSSSFFVIVIHLIYYRVCLLAFPCKFFVFSSYFLRRNQNPYLLTTYLPTYLPAYRLPAYRLPPPPTPFTRGGCGSYA